MSSWTRFSRLIVISTGLILFGALVFIWYRSEGATKVPNGVCPPGRVIGEPTPAIAVRGLPAPPTPLNPNLVSPLNVPRPAPTAIVFSATQTIDLAPALSNDEKGKLYVCKKSGAYVIFLVQPGTPISDLGLENGDVLFEDIPPKGARRVSPPLPERSSPTPNGTPTGMP